MFGNGTVVCRKIKQQFVGCDSQLALLGQLSGGDCPKEMFQRMFGEEIVCPGNIQEMSEDNIRGQGEGTNCTSGEICGINCPRNVCGKL